MYCCLLYSQTFASDCLIFKHSHMNALPDSKASKLRAVKGRVEIDIQKCKGCELCTTACKEHALSLSNQINLKGYRYIIANNDVCTGCVNCALVCPDAVITVYRTKPAGKREVLNEKDAKAVLQQALPSKD